MKYGPIIYDNTSKKTKALIGKKVLGGNNPRDVLCGVGEVVTLDSIDALSMSSFLGHTNSGTKYAYTFIREAIGENPTHRPYKNAEEMVSDYCERFGVVKTDHSMPRILLKNYNKGKHNLITGFVDDYIILDDGNIYLSFLEAFNYCLYLDGSSVGKEINK